MVRRTLTPPRWRGAPLSHAAAARLTGEGSAGRYGGGEDRGLEKRNGGRVRGLKPPAGERRFASLGVLRTLKGDGNGSLTPPR